MIRVGGLQYFKIVSYLCISIYLFKQPTELFSHEALPGAPAHITAITVELL